MIVKKLTSGLPKKVFIYTLATPLVMIGEVVMEALIPILMAKIIDEGIAKSDLPYVLKIGVFMILASCISLVCGMLGARFAAVASHGFARHLRLRVFRKIQEFSFPNIDKFSTSSLVTRLTTDITNIQHVYQMLIRMCVRSPLMIVTGIILSCFIDVSLALIFILVIPFLAVFLFLISSTVFPRFKTMLEKYDLLNRIVQENLIAIRVVKSFVRSDFESEKFEKSAKAVRESQIHAEKIIIFTMPVMRLSIYLCLTAVLWTGSIMIIGETLHVGQLISIVTYAIQVLSSLMMVSMIFVHLILSRASAERICEVLDEVPIIKNPSKTSSKNSVKILGVVASADEVEANSTAKTTDSKDDENAIATEEKSSVSIAVAKDLKDVASDDKSNAVKVVKDGSIDFSSVYFSYDVSACKNSENATVTEDKSSESNTVAKDLKDVEDTNENKKHNYILKNINIHIKPAQFVGILGSTGSGKTSLVQLIPRLYDVSSGVLKLGGINVKSYDTEILRDSVGVVLQKNVLFSGTIKENLRWGNENANDEELIAACKVSDAHNFIMSFPKGYDTVLEQGGVNISGGQKQRLCIARALLKRPKVLILDDSTSAVDTATEGRIREGLKKFLPNTTFIVIAQRISSVKNADCIFVLDNGCINDFGSHEKLLAGNKIYQEIFASQQQGSGDADIYRG